MKKLVVSVRLCLKYNIPDHLVSHVYVTLSAMKVNEKIIYFEVEVEVEVEDLSRLLNTLLVSI